VSHPQTDVIIPVHNAAADLRECIDTLRQHTRSYRVILVDDFSEPEAENLCRQIAKEDPSTILIRSERQRWFTRAVNLGLRLVRTERSVVLNSDCVLGEGWLEELFAVWDECQAQCPQKRIGLIGSIMSDEEPRRYAESIKPDYVTGHCWLLSVNCLFDVSARRGMPGIYLDETKPGTAHIRSDVELCWDMNAMGIGTIKSFKAKVGHKGGRSWNYNIGAISGLRIKDHLTGELA